MYFEQLQYSLFAGMTHILHQSQVHCSVVMQWWAGSSLMSFHVPAEAGCKTCDQIVLLLVFIAQQTGQKSSKFRFGYRDGSRRFAACDCWTQRSCHVGRYWRDDWSQEWILEFWGPKQTLRTSRKTLTQYVAFHVYNKWSKKMGPWPL